MLEENSAPHRAGVLADLGTAALLRANQKLRHDMEAAAADSRCGFVRWDCAYRRRIHVKKAQDLSAELRDAEKRLRDYKEETLATQAYGSCPVVPVVNESRELKDARRKVEEELHRVKLEADVLRAERWGFASWGGALTAEVRTRRMR